MSMASRTHLLRRGGASIETSARWLLVEAIAGAVPFGSRMTVSTLDSDQALSLLDREGLPVRLIRLPPGPSELRFPDDGASGAEVVRIAEAGPLTAAMIIGRNATVRVLRDPGRVLMSMRTALSLVIKGEFREVARRFTARGGGIDIADVASKVEPRAAPRVRGTPSRWPLSVVYRTPDLDLAGAQISLFELAAGLTKQDRVRATVWADRDGPLRADYDAAGIDVVVRPTRSLFAGNVADYRAAVEAETAVLRTLDPDLVHANTIQTFSVLEAATTIDVASLWNLRESANWQNCIDDLPPAVRAHAMSGFGFAQHIIFVSEASRRGWRDRLPADARVDVVPNALNPARFDAKDQAAARMTARARLGIAPGDISVVCVGTLCARKGQGDLLDAAQRLPTQSHDRCRIDFVGDTGDGYGRAIDRDMRKTKGLPARIRHLPATEQIADHYSAADVFVCCSRSESYPRTILEAMAHGLAIVTTGVDGISEQITDGASGLVYAPGDTGQLAAMLERLIADETVRESLARGAGKAFSELPSFEAMLEAYADVYRQMCQVPDPATAEQPS